MVSRGNEVSWFSIYKIMTDNANQKQNKTIGKKLQEVALKLRKQRQLPPRLLSTVNFLEIGLPQRQNFAQTIMQQSQPEKLLVMLPFRRQSLSEITRQEPLFDLEGDDFSQLNQTPVWQANGEQQGQNQPPASPKISALNLPIPVIKQQELKPNYYPKRSYISQLLENLSSAAKQTALNIHNIRLPNQPIVTRIEQQKQFVENIEQQQLVTQIEHSSYSLLDNQIKDFLSKLLKLRLPQTVKIYHNSASESLNQKLNADAITYENKILLSSGRYQSVNSENMALLGHKLTHINQEVSQQNNNSCLQEEQLAIRNEQKIINYLATPPVAQNFSPEQQLLPQPQLPNSSISNITSSSSLPVLKTASASRNLNTPSQMSNLNNKSYGELSRQQLNMIKEEVYRDLIQHIKTEFERGG